MAILSIEHRDRLYTVATDNAVALSDRYWGLIRGRAIDELTGRPLPSARAEAGTAGFAPRSVADGMVGLVARPRDVYPKLAESDYRVDFGVRAPGFIPYARPVDVPALPQFPVRTIDPATDPAIGDILLTLGSAIGLVQNDTLLVGRPGSRERVTVLNANPATGQVTLTAGLVRDHSGGDPVIVEAFAEFDPSASVVDLGDVPMRRFPIFISGQVARVVGGVVTPVPGAAVTVSAIRRRLEPAATANPPLPPNAVSLDPPVYLWRAGATGRLRRRDMMEVLNEDKELTEWADAEASTLHVSDWFGLHLNAVVLVGDDPERQEFATITAISPVGANNLPAAITLAHGLAYRHRPHERVRRVVPQPPGGDRFFADNAIAGDTTVFLTSVAGLANAGVVEVFGGVDPQGNPFPSEYHRLGFLAGQTDVNGRYTFPMMSRVAQLHIQAAEGGDVSPVVEFIPDYGLRENRLDFQL